MAVIEATEDTDLDARLAKPVRETDEEYIDVSEDHAEELTAANDILKRTSILLEFISDAAFCKTITQRERKIIDTHLESIYTVMDKLATAIAELEDDE